MRKIVSKCGIKPLDRTITALKIVIISMCFETDITFVVSELKAKAALREFINWFKKKYTKADLKDKDYKGAYSKSKG